MKNVLLALLAALCFATPLSAQPTPVENAAGPHARLYAVFEAGVDQAVAVDLGLQTLRRRMLEIPQIAQAESREPGTVASLLARARPIFIAHSDRVRASYYPRMLSLMRAELTLEDAADLVDFYTSPIGQKILRASSANARVENVIDAAVTDQSVTAADVEKDLEATVTATLGSLSEAEVAQVYREVAARPALAKLAPMMPKLAALRAQMESEPLSAEDQGALDNLLQAVLGPLLK